MSDEPPRKEYVTECPICQQKVTATVEAYNEFSPDNEFEFRRYLIAACRLCYQPLLLEQAQESDQFERELACVWPTPPRALAESVPEVLRREHFEARMCFKSKAYTATVVMVRRTLEGVCAQHGINKKPLYKAFEEMKTVGLIEGRLLEWAQELRVLGNEGAHFTGKPVTRQDASDAVALAEALLDYLYVFNEQFLRFKERRKKVAEMAEKVAQGAASEKSKPESGASQK
ncbi:DUF4145 domain-containing protein [Streptomyces sp. NBC_01764]|uniref:DUF4145 domain-containing protein n=1 Tax=Streptomyces sp. NBC_01764 TaxID=2975935 RepID=UPI0022512229|nr:DUF4145 domain-containing protein [Streptomyces sp. NBC_01764]MCX4408329.1 DUF4145 domain-containing protein [Streptomyces sp. NBC_01764]